MVSFEEIRLGCAAGTDPFAHEESITCRGRNMSNFIVRGGSFCFPVCASQVISSEVPVQLWSAL